MTQMQEPVLNNRAEAASAVVEQTHPLARKLLAGAMAATFALVGTGVTVAATNEQVRQTIVTDIEQLFDIHPLFEREAAFSDAQ